MLLPRFLLGQVHFYRWAVANVVTPAAAQAVTRTAFGAWSGRFHAYQACSSVLLA